MGNKQQIPYKECRISDVKRLSVAGAGLAGCEAAWQAAKRGIYVDLYEMKPVKRSEAHKADTFAELVCSNSFKSMNIENASGLLKEEMRTMGSLILECADGAKVPAGGALAVDRERFSGLVTEKINSCANINVIVREVTEIPEDEAVIIATGPLTTGALADAVKSFTGKEQLHFFDAAAPLIEADSIDMSRAFRAARYGKGEGDYINCPMNREEYEKFHAALISAETAEVREFEAGMLFEGCMPVECMAQRGRDTIRYGPLKPVGLTDPLTGRRPYAVVQLRQDNAAASLYNMVGFQTHLKWNEQKRVFRMIPGLGNAEFARYGVMHRNTYINSPELLDCTYKLKDKGEQPVYFAGQITGVEGYIESAASGLVAGINAARLLKGKTAAVFPLYTAIGALAGYISSPGLVGFQPMNINFGIIGIPPGLRDTCSKNRLSKTERAEYALNTIRKTAAEV
ncbi:MAG: methylenetetrahydrofolate--tRNA-(uracil(54)-C(5))-methyltransferase (FADH(2)-oxidizing) TrmFO [Eubacteriales bacterium]|nr:methylenetetrahydrofolate--tRNA-(uracil(54)-C(5))-methyltransferase (FADH(2)-oxidizing) TrmFO [Eubacteriales bacterium]